ncbi:porin family protein [Paludibacter sp.]|uniref:porin family protein n=1 Tax=Paludibacter sp. TaxID=1898105 RepID=UPI0013539CEB|nr:porin family protein [Paludibacter sp.]MTK53940.1 PorT family protein [Paludibacter sp.]
MRKISILTVVMCLASFVAINAQVRIGPKVGMNISNMTLSSSGINMSMSTLVGFQVGVVAEIPVATDFVIQPGLLYSSKGTKIDMAGVNSNERLDYLELPVNAMYKIELAGPAKLILFAGPYLGYGVGGKDSMTGEKIKFTGANKDFKALDLGLNFGPGVEIGSLQVTLQYGFSLTNISPESSVTAKNKVFSIALAYLF